MNARLKAQWDNREIPKAVPAPGTGSALATDIWEEF